jgi:hypothetical protein
VIERVAVADTIDGKPGSRLDPFYRSRIRRTEPTGEVIGKVRPQGLGRKFGNGNHGFPRGPDIERRT